MASKAEVISVPVSSGSSMRFIAVAAAAVLVVGAIGIPISRMWLQRAAVPVVQTQEPAPAPKPAPAQAAPPRVEKAVVYEPPAAAPAPVAPAPQIAEIVRPRPAAAVKPAPIVREEPKPAGGPARPERPAGAPGFVLPPTTVAVAPGAISEPPPPAVAPPPAPAPAPAPVAAEPPAPKPAAAGAFPTVPYYELVQVDRPPQVASRVEPRLEGIENLTKEIVIVRVLVSQSGQPHLARVLRPSKSGPALDAAVIAAVEQYTFRPAAKRGEAVSCWLHTAITIAR
jgi:hypothetical protein